MARRGHLRASDEDREQVAERLRRATAEGRLTTAELEHRLTRAFSARTYGELDEILADLPGRSLARRRDERSQLARLARPALGIAIAIPVAFALVAAVTFVLTGVFAMWIFWVALGWWFFGRRQHRYHRYRAAHQRRAGFWL